MERATLMLLVCALAADGGDAQLHTTYGLRERDQLNCGFGQYGSRAGTAQRLVVTHLAPGVADWNVAVPMPPVCKDAQVTGVETAVCDGDAPPDVTMSGPLSARVHRRGALRGFAAVNVTVHCVRTEPPAPAPDPLTLAATGAGHHTDTRSSYELATTELASSELISTELLSHEAVSNGLTSNELFPNAMEATTTTSTSTLRPQEETTTLVEVTTPPQEGTVATSSTQSTPLKEKSSSSLKVTIKIIQQSSHEPVSDQNSVSYEVSLPSSSYKEKPQKVSSTWVPWFAENPRHQARRPPRHPRQPGAQHPHAPHALHARPPMPPPMSPARPPPLPPALAPPLPPQEPLQLLVTPLLRPVRLLRPRITLLHRHAPLFIFQRF